MLYELQGLFTIEEKEIAESDLKKHDSFTVPLSLRDEKLFNAIASFFLVHCDKFYAYYYASEIREELMRTAMRRDPFHAYGKVDKKNMDLLSDIKRMSPREKGINYGLWLYFFNENNLAVFRYEDEGENFEILLKREEQKQFQDFMKTRGFAIDLKKWRR